MLRESLTSRNKTWSQVVAQSETPERGRAPESMRRERLEKIRREKAKTEVLLTLRNAGGEAKAKLASTSEDDLAKGLQSAIAGVGLEPVMIQSVKKTHSHGLKICCPSNEAAEELRKLSWEKPLEGATLVEPSFAIVVHGVSKEDISFESDTPEQLKANIEQSNHETFKVTRVAPLRRRARNPDATTHSIIVSFAAPEEADECILYGIYIRHRRHAAERYTPQCQIKQCFKCQGYGHRADVCTRAVKCGKCAQSHETRTCDSASLQCAECKGPHAAWHHECPVRQKEYQRQEVRREELSPLYTC